MSKSAEAPLTSPAVVRALLNKHGLRANKAFGQHYLVDRYSLEQIVAAAEISSTDTVLEIGPGLGVLTQELAKRAQKVISIELDKHLFPILEQTLAAYSNVELIQGDALNYNFSSLPQSSLLVANLPYNVATTLIIKALESSRFKRLVFLVQKEVAERICAGPKSKSYGALSLIVAQFGVAKRLRDIKPSSFLPAPEITSSLVRLDVDPQAKANPTLVTLIHESFRHRRKTLRKNLQMASYPEAKIKQAFEVLGLDEKIRAEALTLGTFARLLPYLKG